MARTMSSPNQSRFAALTEDDIRSQTDDGSYRRGRTYYRQSRIRDTALRGNIIEAHCQGSESWPYHVTATLVPDTADGRNPTAYACSCPRGGFCKHVVALLLTWIHEPDRFTERESIVEQLAGRSLEELVAIIERMVKRYPELERLVELPVPVAVTPDVAIPANKVTVNCKSIRRQVRAALAGLEGANRSYRWDSWGGGMAVPDDVRTVVELGQSYAAAGQWANAKVVFEALAGETTGVLLSLDDESGEFAEIVIDADAGLAACLDAQADLPGDQQLSAEAREELIRAIYEIWRFDIFEAGGIGLSQRGVDALVRGVTGDERAMVEEWLRQERADGWSKDAVIGFLVDLREAAGADAEELLAIFREAELWDDVAMMLLSMGRIDEAVATAGRHIRTAPRLVAFADALIGLGEEHASRAIALVDDLAWETEGSDAGYDLVLQDWLIDRYSHHDRPREALTLAERRFRRQPDLRTYDAVREAAALPGQPEGAWGELRPVLVGRLRTEQAWAVLVDIHLAEGDVAAALDAFDRESRQREERRTGVWTPMAWGYDERKLRLARAAEQEFPDRALAIYRASAEREIERRDRSSYKLAAGHLARVKKILERRERQDEWTTLITELRERNKRLRALREELDNLELR